MASSLPFLLFYISSLPTLSMAYTWKFESPPKQCSNLTVSLADSGGNPPYRIMILPYGPTPLTNSLEVRTILDVQFPTDSTSVSFQLKYPANSQLVAVVSDSTAFGSGGTSATALVTTSSDSSCFNSSSQTSPDFVFSIEPANQIVQCANTRIWWDNSTVQGIPNFLGVIPGGQSFAVPESNITNVYQQGTGFTWKPSLRGGTTLILVGGDSRGNGTAGSVTNIVGAGTQNDISCLSDTSPSSTAGDPAGGSYPTGNGGGWTGKSSGGASVGAIVGGVLGGLVLIIACILLLWVFRRRQRKQKGTKKLAVDLTDGDDDDDSPRTMRQNELPQNYQPEPFMVPIPDTASELDDDLSTRDPLSARSSFYTRAETPDRTSTFGGLGVGGVGGGSSAGGRKGGAPKPLRAVNIIQHQDAGPTNNEVKEETVETIELPPAYTMVRTGGGPSSASTSAGGRNGEASGL